MNKEYLLNSLVVIASENLKLEEVIKEALEYMDKHFNYKDGLLISIPTENEFEMLKRILQNRFEEDGE